MRNATEYQRATEQIENEKYIICENETIRSLLPGETPGADERGKLLMLQREICVEGVAGAGGVALDAERILGGWCSFGCQLAVPRRFAVREGRRLAEGVQAERILSEMLRGVLAKLFADAQAQIIPGTAQLKKLLGRRFREEAELELILAGWRMTHCRLEEVQITRRI